MSSVFKKEEAVNGTREIEVIKTGGEVDGHMKKLSNITIVTSMVSHSYDKDEGVRSGFTFALVDIGSKQPTLVLSALITFMYKNQKLDLPHRIQLLGLVEKIIETKRDAVNEQLAEPLIRFLSKEMTKDQEVINDQLAQPCSTCLVVLSVSYAPLVLDALLALFKHGEMPHYYIIKTLADVAATNGVQFTLRLKDILTRSTPCLGNIKKPNNKWVFSVALGRYADALQHFLINADEDMKNQVNASSFELDIQTGFDMLFNNWLAQTPESKVKFAIVESLGYMAPCLERPAFEARLPKLVPKYLEMYKQFKPNEHLPISQGFYNIMREGVKTPCFLPLVPSILTAVHPMLCRTGDMSSPLILKNHNELLRLMEVLAKAEMEQTLNFLVNRFQLKEKDVRIGSLIILRHLVNSIDDVLDDKRPLIMNSVGTMTTETDLVVKKSIMQLIVSMSNHNYLSMEGGQRLITFIIQQCSMPVDEEEKKADTKDPNSATPLQIRNAANHILVTMATKVASSRQVMWPYLLELIADENYSRAILVICKCIAFTANLKREENASDYMLNWEIQVSLPPPQAILARLMVLAAEPFRKPDTGVTMCKAMLGLGPNIHPAIGKYWDESMPALVEHLESHTADSINVSKWQDTLLKLWKETVSLVDNTKWLMDLTEKLTDQMKLYKNDSSSQRVIHRYIGSLLAKIERTPLIEKTLDIQLNSVNHKNDNERQGLAQGMGMAAFSHLDLVLTKITERIGKSKEKKSGGWFSGGNDSQVDDQLYSTIILAYGYTAAYSNPELILSRLDVNIMHNLLPIMPKAKSNLLRLHIIKSIDLLGKAIHTSRLPEEKKKFKLSQRDELITNLLSYLLTNKRKNMTVKGDDKVKKEVRISGEIRVLGLNAISTLVSLEPPVGTELKSKILTAILPYFQLNEKDLIDTSEKEKEKDKKDISTIKKSDDETSADGVNTVMNQIQVNLQNVLSCLIDMDTSLNNTLVCLQMLEPFLVSTKSVERERSTSAFSTVVKKFLTKLVGEEAVPHEEKTIPQLGLYLAMILPRTTDSIPEIRKLSVENVQALLCQNIR